jgi:hypothetical protein
MFLPLDKMGVEKCPDFQPNEYSEVICSKSLQCLYQEQGYYLGAWPWHKADAPIDICAGCIGIRLTKHKKGDEDDYERVEKVTIG